MSHGYTGTLETSWTIDSNRAGDPKQNGRQLEPKNKSPENMLPPEQILGLILQASRTRAHRLYTMPQQQITAWPKTKQKWKESNGGTDFNGIFWPQTYSVGLLAVTARVQWFRKVSWVPSLPYMYYAINRLFMPYNFAGYTCNVTSTP